jgi:ankyrin repeat protein
LRYPDGLSLGTIVRKLTGRYGDPGWFEAARRGDVEALRAMIARGAKIGARDDHDDTALTWAAAEGRVEACRALLEAGADPDARQYQGATALMLAADRGHLAVVEALIEGKADLNLKHPGEYISALDFAARAGHKAIVDRLDAAGASWR